MSEQDVLDKLGDVLDKIEDNKGKLAELEDMLNEDKSVQIICPHCGGDGYKIVAPNGGVGNCPDCGGDGVRPFGRITKKIDE